MIAAAGDIACAHDDSHYNDGAGSPGFCRQRVTSDLLVDAGLAAVLPLGDIQYDSASATELNLVYDPTDEAGNRSRTPALRFVIARLVSR